MATKKILILFIVSVATISHAMKLKMRPFSEQLREVEKRKKIREKKELQIKKRELQFVGIKQLLKHVSGDTKISDAVIERFCKQTDCNKIKFSILKDFRPYIKAIKKTVRKKIKNKKERNNFIEPLKKLDNNILKKMAQMKTYNDLNFLGNKVCCSERTPEKWPKAETLCLPFGKHLYSLFKPINKLSIKIGFEDY